MMKKLTAELIGTFMLVSAVCGAGALGTISGSYLHVALAVGTAATAMAFAVGHISGAHFNPAVTCGLVAAGRHPASDAIPYIIAQVLGAVAAGFVWYVVGHSTGADLGTFVSNGYDAASPGKYSLGAVALVEVMVTALFLFVIVGSTAKSSPAGLAPLAMGFAVFVCFLITVPVSNGSINPARSTGTAVWAGALPLAQLWLFWVAPIVGGIVGGLIARYVQSED